MQAISHTRYSVNNQCIVTLSLDEAQLLPMFTDDLVELISSLFDPIHPNNWIPVGVRHYLWTAIGQSDTFWHFLTGSGFFKKTHKHPKLPKCKKGIFYFQINDSRWDLCHFFHCITCLTLIGTFWLFMTTFRGPIRLQWHLIHSVSIHHFWFHKHIPKISCQKSKLTFSIT